MAVPSSITTVAALADGSVYRIEHCSMTGLLCAGEGPDLQLIDITVPSYPVRLGHIRMPEPVTGMATEGRYAYLAAGNSGLYIVDLGDPANPVAAGVLAFPGKYLADLAVSGGTVYVAAGDGGLAEVDVRNPSAPVLRGSAATRSHAMAVAPLPGTASSVLVAEQNHGLSVFAKPAGYPAWSRRGALNLPGGCVDLAATEGTLLCAGLTGGLTTFDMTAPTAPVFTGRADQPVRAAHIAVAEGGEGEAAQAYVTDEVHVSQPSLWRFDLKNPAAPALKQSYVLPAAVTGNATSGSTAFILEESGLRLIDAVRPDRNGAYPVANIMRLAVGNEGARVYLLQKSKSGGQVLILDVRDAQQITQIGAFPVPLDAVSLAVAGTRVYFGGAVLEVHETAEPSLPVRLGFTPLPAVAQVLTVVDNRVYVAAPGDGLRVYDFSVPDLPVEIARATIPGTPSALVVDGEYIFVAAGDAGVFVLGNTPQAPISRLLLPWIAR